MSEIFCKNGRNNDQNARSRSVLRSVNFAGTVENVPTNENGTNVPKYFTIAVI